MKLNELIEASAGTGKTQALAERLIELLHLGVKPSEIVALTFSRAAAGEIFERFVTLLAERGETKLLREVIAGQHLSQIGTLDSFLLRIVRAFPDELGLDGDLKLMDEYESASAVARVSFSILRRTDAKLAKTFVEAFSLAMNHDDVRSFVEAYRDFIKIWHDRVATLKDAASWGEAATIWGKVPAFTGVTEGDLAVAADALIGLDESEAWSDFAEWVRSFRGSFASLKGIAKKIFEIDDIFEHASIEFKYRRKFAFSGEAARKIQQAVLCVAGYVIRQKLELAKGIYRLVAGFEKEYAVKVRQPGNLVFADIPRLLAGLDESARMAIEYRLDSRIRAWALDEFQDTSREQWGVLSPLLDEAKQSNGDQSVFIVGDTKQAIYGWRNGDVSIFHRERDARDGNGEPMYARRELTKSWRFGPAVTEAVNRVFAHGRIFTEFPAWQCPEHSTARPELGGFVRVSEALGRFKADFVEPVCAAIMAVDPMARGLSTAILVRDNKFGKLLADGLKQKGLVNVMWEGESSVYDTPALSAFLDLVHLADHPGDQLVYRHFKLTPLCRAKYPDEIPSVDAISREFALAFTQRGMVRVFRELRALLPADAEQVWSRFTEVRFNELLKAAAQFELAATAETRLADFPRFLDSLKRRTLAEPGMIKIMTIHRSKGLGFDYVVLPLYEHETLTGESKGPLVTDDWILPDPGEQALKEIPGLNQARQARRDRNQQEALCTYYVAMTRAKRAMSIILHPAAEKSSGVRFSDLVRSALGVGGIGSDDIASQSGEASSSVSAKPIAPIREPRQYLHRRLPSKKYVSGQSAAALFAVNSSLKVAAKAGIAAHAEFEKVEFNDWIVKPADFKALWRERDFEVYVDGEWISGRFDRVVFHGDGATIQDFKTGSHVDPSLYRNQLLTYRRALSALTGIPQSRIACELLLTRQQSRLPLV